MSTDSTPAAEDANLFLGEAWLDPIEAGTRDQIRGFIEGLIEDELASALGRARYQRPAAADAVPAEGVDSAATAVGHRHGRRRRQLQGSFGAVELAVPRARLQAEGGGTREWRSAVLPRYRRQTQQVEALIAGTYLAGTNTRRVRRALAALFKGAISKDTESRLWRRVKTDWEAWSKRSLAEEDVVRLILGTVVRVRLDKKATKISLLVVLGVRRDGQKILLAIKNMGGESEAAWRAAILDDLLARGLKTPELLIVDGAAGLEKALAVLWPEVPTQRCTAHQHRNLLAHAPDRLHEEASADYTDMIYAATADEVRARRRYFILKWKLKCAAVADSLEEAVDRLFTFTRLPPGQWKSARTTNAVERLHEEFKRRIKTQTVLPDPGPRQCCSGRCSRRARSQCARWMAGRRSPNRLPTASLISPPDPLPSTAGDTPILNSYKNCDGTRDERLMPEPRMRLGGDQVAQVAWFALFPEEGAVGKNRTKLDNARGFSAGFTIASIVMAASQLGLPVSTSQAGLGTIGTGGATEPQSKLFWKAPRP